MSNELIVKVFKDTPNALPKYETEGAAAMDVCSAIDTYLVPRQRKIVPTNIYVEIPEGYKINVLPRSGFAIKQGITVINAPGLIDADFRGNVSVLLVNLGDDTVDIRVGDRIAQIEIAPVYKIKWETVSSKEGLSTTVRGEGGMGSSGMR